MKLSAQMYVQRLEMMTELLFNQDDKRMRPSRISKSHNGRRDYRRNHQPLRGYRVHVTNLYYGLSKEDLEVCIQRNKEVKISRRVN